MQLVQQTCRAASYGVSVPRVASWRESLGNPVRSGISLPFSPGRAGGTAEWYGSTALNPQLDHNRQHNLAHYILFEYY